MRGYDEEAAREREHDGRLPLESVFVVSKRRKFHSLPGMRHAMNDAPGVHDSLDATYFDRKYAGNGDPWDFATSPYEAQKYRATLDALPLERFERAFEIGCSIGVLTEMLASRCESLLSVDVSDRALEQARERCSELHTVRFARMSVPREFPSESFDLVMVSEVGYYWSSEDLACAIDRIASAATGGTVVLVHYTPFVDEYPQTGDAVHAAFLSDARFEAGYSKRAERYRIDVLHVK
jgi:SAM-dependent methyltransferase